MLLIIAIYCWTYFSITLHELSHLFAAKKLGMRLYSVTVGTGPTLVRTRIKGVAFNLHVFPGSGLTYATYESLWNIRRAELIFSAAGPAANLLLICAIASLLLFAPPFQHGELKGALFAFITIEAWLAALNISPRMGKIGTQQVPTDGRRFFETLRKTQKSVEEEFLSGLRTVTAPYAAKGSPIDNDRVPFGGSHANIDLFLRSQMAVSVGDYERAAQIFEGLSRDTSLSDAETAFMFDCLTSLTTIYGQRAYRNRSRNWVEQGLKLSPDCGTLRATKGALMIEYGSLAKGTELLLPFIEPDVPDIDREVSAAYLAKAEFLKGNLAQATTYLQLAESIGLVKLVTERIKQETASLRHG